MPEKKCTHTQDGESTLEFVMINVAPYGDTSDIREDLPIAAFCSQCNQKLSRNAWEQVVLKNREGAATEGRSENIPWESSDMATFVAAYLLPNMTEDEKLRLAATLDEE